MERVWIRAGRAPSYTSAPLSRYSPATRPTPSAVSPDASTWSRPPDSQAASSGARTRNAPVDTPLGVSQSLTTTAAISRYGAATRQDQPAGSPLPARSSATCCTTPPFRLVGLAEVPCTIGRPGTRRQREALAVGSPARHHYH